MGETADFHWDSKGAGSNERSRRGSCSKLSGKRTIFGRHSGKSKEHPRSNLLRTERRIFQVERQRRKDDRISEWISVIRASLFCIVEILYRESERSTFLFPGADFTFRILRWKGA